MSWSPPVENLLQANIQWSQAVAKADPDFFERSAKGQSPQVSAYLA